MCILCVIQKWSRRVATMLPWLVIPLIGLWALSQLLPPAFRFEITSPRLACFFVLLVTLFWYEILMPQLSAWRVRRNARLREKKRFEAIEMHKLRKTATRRCRNCLTPYKDQKPGGGRFMCSYCGHISKRPVLDLPVPPGLGLSNSEILKDLVGKGGKILNGKALSDNSWACGQDWLEKGNWVSESFSGKSSYWRQNGGGVFSGDDHCMADNSYSWIVMVACKILTTFFWGIGWLWRKITRVSSSKDDTSSDAENTVMLARQGENEGSFNASKGEKARRKAEEKRQARIERELLEEEERKQREEVARLVEERRRLRGEKIEVEKDRGRNLTSAMEKDSKKEAEKKRQQRRKEKDKWSSKSNSDAEELEKRAGKEIERKREFDRKSDTDRVEHQRTSTESAKSLSTEMSHGIKSAGANNYSRVNAGTRYLDRVKGTFLSSSKAFGGGGFFRKGFSTTAVNVSRENKPYGSVDHFQPSANRRELSQPRKSIPNGDAKTVNPPVLIEPQLSAAPKKSWQQLFTRSATVAPVSTTNVISRPNGNSQAEVHNLSVSGHSSAVQSYDNPINFGLPSPFTLPAFPSLSTSSTVPPLTSEAMFPRIGEAPRDYLPEDSDIFEDPCYVPDPVSLLGPVSESLNNFQLDLGSGFASDMGLEKPRALKNIFAAAEVNRPSPIESPMSRIRVSDGRHSNSNRFLSSPKAQDVVTSPKNDLNTASENGTWQMWNSTSLGHDGIGLVNGAASWLLPPELNKSNDVVHPTAQKTIASLFSKDDQVFGGTPPPKVFLDNSQNRGPFCTSSPYSTDDLWSANTLFGQMPGVEGHLSINPHPDASQNETMYGSPNFSATSRPLEYSPVVCWPKKERGSGEGIVNSSIPRPSTIPRPHIGGLYSTPDEQSLWSYD